MSVRVMFDGLPNALCEPRITWEGCDTQWQDMLPTFYAIAGTLQALIFVFYLVTCLLYTRDGCRASKQSALATCFKAPNLASQLRLGVVFFSGLGCVHHLCLLSPVPALPWQLVEVMYNGYNVFLVGTLFLLLRFWYRLCGMMSPRYESHMQAADKSFYLVMVMICSLVAMTDALLLSSPNTVDGDQVKLVMIRIQHFMWLVVCLGISGSYLVLGTKVVLVLNTTSRDAKADSPKAIATHKARLFKIKLIYAVNTVLWSACFLFCMLAGVFMDDIAVSIAFWAFIYGMFNVAGLLVAVVLAPLVGRSSAAQNKSRSSGFRKSQKQQSRAFVTSGASKSSKDSKITSMPNSTTEAVLDRDAAFE
jgi:hypothetical protein